MKDHRDPIAVVGLGCRFPGGADSPQAFWRLLLDGVDAIGEIPADRFDVARLYDPRPGVPGRVATRYGGFLDGIDRFDAGFFRISPREADRLDPQQRLLLEVAWEALEDAGSVPEHLAGSPTGVFVGMWINDYEGRLFSDPDGVDFYMTTGSGRYSASGRLSYVFGLQGPSMTVDTACSSSLVAVHLACRSLWSGECSAALAGAANTILQPHVSIAYSQSRMLAPDGRCKFGDARANGYVRSEGAGLVVLKRLSDALAAGDPVRALILGTAVNNDGSSSVSMGTPGQAGQEDLLRKAYRDAGIPPGSVQYVEAHGTGTSAGDPVELAALGAVLGQGRPAGSECLVGSVKTNVGHTEGAAGLAGLIKVVLALENRTVPPSLHFQSPNPAIPWERLPLAIPTAPTPWPADGGPARAGVSAFGIAGTNGHLVVEAAPSIDSAPAAPPDRDCHLLVVSGHTADALKARARDWAGALASHERERLADAGYTAGARRAQHEHRLAVVSQSGREAAEQLSAFAAGEPGPRTTSGNVRPGGAGGIAFVFPGQGSQWLGMGRQLLAREPVFRESLEACDAAISGENGWSVVYEIGAPEGRSRLDQIDVIQPTLFAVQVSLAALWRGWGIEPQAVVGHSMGEIAAAHVAGVLSLPDAARVICRRSRLLLRTRGQGAMAVVDLSMAEAARAIAGYEERLSVAVSNSSRSTVLSGDPGALDEVMAALEARDVFCRRVKVDVASHSPQMDPLRGELLAALEGLAPGAAAVPVYSTVAGRVVEGRSMDAGYWVRNLREPVLFSTAVSRLLEDGCTALVEISPHPILVPAMQQEIQHLGRDALALGSTRREEDEQAALLDGVGVLYCHGRGPDWTRLFGPGRRVAALPSYPWQRERFWHDGGRRKASRRGSGHPLLGPHVRSSAQPGTHLWETEVGTDVLPLLADHRVGEAVVMPAAAFAEMAIAAGRAAFGVEALTLEDVVFEEALVLPAEGSGRTVQVVVAESLPGTASFSVSSLDGGEGGSWTVHARGSIRSAPAAVETATPGPPSPEVEGAAAAARHYAAMAERGLRYGPAFRGIEELWPAEGGVAARLRVPEAAGTDSGFGVHPTLLDAGFQLLLAALAEADGAPSATEAYLPVALRSLEVRGMLPPDLEVRGVATLRDVPSDSEGIEGDLALFAGEGGPVLEARGLRMKRLARSARGLARCFFGLEWEERALGAGPGPAGPGTWILFADSRGVASRLASLLEGGGRGDRCLLVRCGDAYAKLDARTYQVDGSRREDLSRLLEEAGEGGPACRGLVHMWSLDAADAGRDGAKPPRDPERLCGGVLHLVQAVAVAGSQEPPRLWLVTAGAQAPAQAEPVAVSQAALWGLARVIGNEHPELRCTSVDLSPDPDEVGPLAAELRAASPEREVALHGGTRRVARLAPWSLPRAEGQRPVTVPAAGRAYRFEVSSPGVLDNLTARPRNRRPPAAGQVEIEVAVAGLNFMNVMSALGIYPGYPNGVGPLGIECAGRIAAVGEGVGGLRVGDEVVAVAFDCLGTHAVTDARLVRHRPPGMSAEQAATVPIVFMTAWYALHHLGRLAKGETVLIHAAAGGVGLAALQLARRAGAEVLATAGSPEKRALVKSLGAAQVMDSRSLEFARETLRHTRGRGVDVVLNSLAGEAIPASLRVLAPYGRFLEIGKRDIYRNAQVGLEPFQKNLSYAAIDLDRFIRERTEQAGALLGEVMEGFAAGELQPIPHQVFPASRTPDAFRHMAQARHMGKIVIDVRDPAVRLEQTAFNRGSYLVTGGLGGLGLEVARWLAAKGVPALALVGRGEPSAAAAGAVDELRRAGIQVLVGRADVSDSRQLARVFEAIDAELPPLTGVVHAAGILDDGILLQQDAARFASVMAPKVAGAWNLHVATAGRPLQHFVLFSSVAALLGTPGQGNYAAGNAFLDALAAHRRRLGLPGTSIAWGPWSGVGLAAANSNRGQRLALQGLESLRPADGIEALGLVLEARAPHVAVMPFDAARWGESLPAAAGAPLFERLRAGGGALGERGTGPVRPAGIREALLAVEPGRRRRSLLESHLQERVAQVLRLAPSRIELGKPLRTLGLDSLMALELRNRLEADLGLTLPATLVWNYPTVAALAPHLATRLQIPLDGPQEPDRGTAPAPEESRELDRILDEIEELSPEEARRLLAEEP